MIVIVASMPISLWQVFLDDKERPGRYILAKEQPTRPNPDDLDVS